MSREVRGAYRWISTALFAVGLALSVIYIFQRFPFGLVLYQYPCMFAIFGCFGSSAFLYYAFRKSSPRHRIPWYDTALFAITLGITGYFFSKGYTSAMGWEFSAPLLETILALVLIWRCWRRAGVVPGWLLL